MKYLSEVCADVASVGGAGDPDRTEGHAGQAQTQTPGE